MAAQRTEYSQLQVAASYSVLIELSHLLNEYYKGFVVVGGWVPGLLFKNPVEEHIGTIDVDLALDHREILDVGYRTIMQLLLSRGYVEGNQPFIFYRTVRIDSSEIKVEVDFLSGEYGGTGEKHRTQKVQDMQPRKARACDLAFQEPVEVVLEGTLPGGGKDQARIRVASVVPFLMMKAQALRNRLKEKDAYDIYYCLVNYPGGIDPLVEEFQSFLHHSLVIEGLKILAEKFETPEHVGPVHVVNFLEENDPDSRALIQRDVFERMDYLLRRLEG
ncbi:MAG: hypothetical protein GYA17_19010 [Chloroflexi bacterium]|nr:hypothetical protein [Anaerolineaceae bacterium]NMB90457.1 hypothetical protein [Chloroflexota bacterium]